MKTGKISGNRKIKSLQELAVTVRGAKSKGWKVVHCHGVFDLLHVGHIKHLQAAKQMGDVLVVTLTPDRFVNKGPHRPAFPEHLRLEAMAALECVDYVALNEWPTAIETIRLLKPDLYVKGIVREGGKRDHTDAIIREQEAVEAVGGKLVLTDEETFSASSLINKYLNTFSPNVTRFLEQFRNKYEPADIVRCLEKLKGLRVLTIGDTIVDEYEFCKVIGSANKDPILVARHRFSERYAGGILAITNHIANFCKKVGLCTLLGEVDSQEKFIRSSLNANISPQFFKVRGSQTIVKRRFLDDYKEVKLFEVNVLFKTELPVQTEKLVCAHLKRVLKDYDVVLVADYGHGMMSRRIIDLLCDKARFLAVNVQVNAANRGFNTISKYPRADMVSLQEGELRFDARDLDSDIRKLMKRIVRRISCKHLMVTRGDSGSTYFDSREGYVDTPALAVKIVDRIGAGDAVYSLVGPCAAVGMPADVIGFVGNVAGAEACTIIGNKSSIQPASLYRHITSLLK